MPTEPAYGYRNCKECGRLIYACQKYCRECGMELGWDELTQKFKKKKEVNNEDVVVPWVQ